jgi:hypothetical protein
VLWTFERASIWPHISSGQRDIRVAAQVIDCMNIITDSNNRNSNTVNVVTDRRTINQFIELTHIRHEPTPIDNLLATR